MRPMRRGKMRRFTGEACHEYTVVGADMKAKIISLRDPMGTNHLLLRFDACHPAFTTYAVGKLGR